MVRGLIGMVHLGPLPGAPHPTPLAKTIDRAIADAVALTAAGFDGLLVENFGDAPFHADDVPKMTVAAMTRAVGAVVDTVNIPVGVNVLRNDALAALAVAAATGAAFIRVNVLSGSMWTDQGLITGRAAELARRRTSIGSDIAVLADVMVKHATPPPGLTLEQAALDLWERAGADGIVISGSGTGRPLDSDDLSVVSGLVPDAPLFAGSGVTADTVRGIMSICAGAIVGTAAKVDGRTTNPVDPVRAGEIVEANR